jgi:hypothetical protein
VSTTIGPSLAERVSTKLVNPLVADLWRELEAHKEAAEALADLHVAVGPEHSELCRECGQPYPCRTRQYLYDLENADG